jgi:hypothetical protein
VKLLGQSLMARDFDRQVAEIQTALPFSTATPLLAYLLLRSQAKSVRGKGKHVPHLICVKKSKRTHHVTLFVAGDDRCQNILPAIGAVGIAFAQGTALKIAELIEHKQRVVTLAAKVTVPGRAFLIAVGGAGGAIHVQRDPLRWLRVVHGINPLPGKISQSGKVVGRCKYVGLEPRHLTG